jgi:hypothetical protein
LLDRYRDRDAETFLDLMQRARVLIDDPLQQMLLFINLFAEVFTENMEDHPGCLSASFAYEDFQFTDEIRQLNQQNLRRWREIFTEQLERVNAQYPMTIETDIESVADLLVTNIQDGLVLAIVHGDSTWRYENSASAVAAVPKLPAITVRPGGTFRLICSTWADSCRGSHRSGLCMKKAFAEFRSFRPSIKTIIMMGLLITRYGRGCHV